MALCVILINAFMFYLMVLANIGSLKSFNVYSFTLMDKRKELNLGTPLKGIAHAHSLPPMGIHSEAQHGSVCRHTCIPAGNPATNRSTLDTSTFGSICACLYVDVYSHVHTDIDFFFQNVLYF